MVPGWGPGIAVRPARAAVTLQAWPLAVVPTTPKTPSRKGGIPLKGSGVADLAHSAWPAHRPG